MTTKYNIIFPGIKHDTFKNKSLVLPISLPLPPYTESWLKENEAEQEERLKSVLLYIVNSRPKLFHIILADTLQRFTISNANGCTEDEAKIEVEKKKRSFSTVFKKMDRHILNRN